MKDYLEFVRRNARFLAFGGLLTFSSNFGQTFFIALFGDELRRVCDLGHGAYGGLYSLATLSSAACLVVLGPRLDTTDLRRFTAAVVVGLALACFGMAAVPGALALGLVFFGLRLFGQGLMSHTAMTSMSRYFVQRRGTAMSVASLGFAVGEGILPLLVVGALALLSWREVWLACGAAVLLLQLPLAQWLLVGQGERHARFLEATRADEANADQAGQGEGGGATAGRRRQWTQGQVLRDPCFYLLLPAVLANPFVLTGVFFHQVHVVEQKGWSLSLLAGSFSLFAGFKIGAALLAGPLVDRAGAVRLLPGFLAPLALGLLALALVDHPAALIALMSGAGLSMGAGANIVGAMWAEVYGSLHLGAIRSMATAVMVFSTSLSPVALGALFDRGVSVEGVAGLLLGYVVASAALVTLAAARLAKRVARPAG